MSAPPTVPVELPEPEELARALSGRLPGFGRVEWVASTGSTNADLMARARVESDGKPWLLGAHLQQSGRGRAGRAWQNRSGAALMVSCAFDAYVPSALLPALSPMAGVAVCEALRSLAGPAADRLGVKWPNDVQWEEAKLAGLLVETVRCPGDPHGGHAVVIGMGMNLDDAEQISRALDRPVADWAGVTRAATGGKNGREAAPAAADLVAAIANALLEALRELHAAGFSGFVERYRRVDALAGREVNVIDQGRLVQHGIARGIDEQGRLCIDTPEGMHAVTVGEISIRTK
jgi:BirA family biotin operon repressor/biotin-[acetyl-CoA-carboxylase] ligase